MMPRILYTLVYALCLPLILLRLLWRSRLAPAYRHRWLERFGIFAPPRVNREQPIIWLHAVSVGEVLAAVPLVKSLQKKHTQWQWVLTSTTPTGSERVKAVFADDVFHVYAPYDLPFFVRQFLRHVKPSLLIVMETELWPNLLHVCKTQQIPSIVANARLSEKSCRGYARFAPLTRTMLDDVSLVAAQQHADGMRFLALGLSPAKLHITGSIKFDLLLDDAIRAQAAVLRAQWTLQDRRAVWLAASTHPSEESVVLAAFSALKKQFPDLLLVLVPRHPERFSPVAAQCEAAGWRVLRRSSGKAASLETDVVLGDSMGELLVFYGAANMAFVGGSLVPVGGHNLIEPAAWACPVISGSHLFNFAEVARLLDAEQALIRVENSEELAVAVARYMINKQEATHAGLNAQRVVEQHRGALVCLCAVIESSLLPVNGRSP